MRLHTTVMSKVNHECHSSGATPLCFWDRICHCWTGQQALRVTGTVLMVFECRDFPDFILKARERPGGLCAAWACASHVIRSLPFLLYDERTDDSGSLVRRCEIKSTSSYHLAHCLPSNGQWVFISVGIQYECAITACLQQSLMVPLTEFQPPPQCTWKTKDLNNFLDWLGRLVQIRSLFVLVVCGGGLETGNKE